MLVRTCGLVIGTLSLMSSAYSTNTTDVNVSDPTGGSHLPQLFHNDLTNMDLLSGSFLILDPRKLDHNAFVNEGEKRIDPAVIPSSRTSTSTKDSNLQFQGMSRSTALPDEYADASSNSCSTLVLPGIGGSDTDLSSASTSTTTHLTKDSNDNGSYNGPGTNIPFYWTAGMMMLNALGAGGQSAGNSLSISDGGTKASVGEMSGVNDGVEGTLSPEAAVSAHGCEWNSESNIIHRSDQRQSPPPLLSNRKSTVSPPQLPHHAQKHNPWLDSANESALMNSYLMNSMIMSSTGRPTAQSQPSQEGSVKHKEDEEGVLRLLRGMKRLENENSALVKRIDSTKEAEKRCRVIQQQVDQFKSEYQERFVLLRKSLKAFAARYPQQDNPAAVVHVESTAGGLGRKNSPANAGSTSKSGFLSFNGGGSTTGVIVHKGVGGFPVIQTEEAVDDQGTMGALFANAPLLDEEPELGPTTTTKGNSSCTREGYPTTAAPAPYQTDQKQKQRLNELERTVHALVGRLEKVPYSLCTALQTIVYLICT